MATIERAIEIAASAHAGQVDKAGRPYILHPLRVMLRVEAPEEMMAAVLHDVVEDTSVTVTQLEAEGFPESVTKAVEALTKRDGESRIEAARRAKANPIARAVKIADNAENLDISRILTPTARDFERLKEYEMVRKLLLSEGDL